MKPQAAPGPGEAAVLLLCSEEPSLRRALERASSPAGRGLRVLADGKKIAASEKLARVTGDLPPDGAPPTNAVAAASAALRRPWIPTS